MATFQDSVWTSGGKMAEKHTQNEKRLDGNGTWKHFAPISGAPVSHRAAVGLDKEVQTDYQIVCDWSPQLEIP